MRSSAGSSECCCSFLAPTRSPARPPELSQRRAGHRALPIFGVARDVRMPGLCPGEAQAEAGATAAIDGTLEGHRAAVRFRDVLHDREAEAGSGKMTRVVRSPEAVEHARRILSGDPRTVVAHRDLTVRDRDVDRRTWRAVLRGIVEKIR